MGLFVGCPQIRGAEVRVDLRRDQAFMPEQFLHAANVGSTVQKMRGKAMPQRMRTGPPVQSGLAKVLFQHPPHAAVVSRVPKRLVNSGASRPCGSFGEIARSRSQACRARM